MVRPKLLSMQFIWLLPSLAFGIYLGLFNGQWLAAAFSVATLVALAASKLIRKPTVVSEDSPVHWGTSRVAVNNRPLSRFSRFWKPETSNLLAKQALAENQARVAQHMANRKLAGSLAAQSCSDHGLSFWAGYQGSALCEIDLVAAGPNALVVGQTGSGKSQFLRLMISSLLAGYSHEKLKLLLFDFKGGATLNEFNLPERSLGLVTDLDGSKVTQQLEQLKELLHEREVALALSRATRIEETQNYCRVLVVVDEVAALLAVRGASEVFEATAARGRSLGVHLVVAGQSVSGLSRALLVNLGLRFALGNFDVIEAAQLGIKTSSIQQVQNHAGEKANGSPNLMARFVGNQGAGSVQFGIVEAFAKRSFSGNQLTKSLLQPDLATKSEDNLHKRNEIQLAFQSSQRNT